MNKKITLYNVMFPIWMLILFPQFLIFIIPINFLVDSLVILITGKVRKLKNIMECYKKSIVKVFLLGFLSDIIGAILMLVPIILEGNINLDPIINEIISAIISNPFSNVFALIYVLIAIIISMFCIYNFNLKISFKKLDIEDKDKKSLALALMFITAPYTFLIPMTLLHL